MKQARHEEINSLGLGRTPNTQQCCKLGSDLVILRAILFLFYSAVPVTFEKWKNDWIWLNKKLLEKAGALLLLFVLLWLLLLLLFVTSSKSASRNLHQPGNYFTPNDCLGINGSDEGYPKVDEPYHLILLWKCFHGFPIELYILYISRRSVWKPAPWLMFVFSKTRLENTVYYIRNNSCFKILSEIFCR